MPDRFKRGSTASLVIAVILIVAAMKVTRAVTMPLGIALFILTLAWPVQSRLERRMPRPLAYVITVAMLLLLVGVFGMALAFSVEQIAEGAPAYAERGQHLVEMLAAEAGARNLAIQPDGLDLQSAMRSVISVLQTGVTLAWTLLGTLVLIMAFVVLGLVEAHTFEDKLREISPGLTGTFTDIGSKYQSYMVVRSLVSLATGLCTWGFTAAYGLDFPFVWGLVAFVLNFIPTLGSIVAVVPPTALAFIQFGSLGWGLGALAGLASIQLTLGGYLEPLLHGRVLTLSPLGVLVSIVFWGWVWGIPGAIIGVPITIALVGVAAQFEQTRPFAVLFGQQIGQAEPLFTKRRHRPNSEVPVPDTLEGL